MRLSVSPFNTIAIVEYEHSNQAVSAMKYLAYYKINYINPIYLEFAPQVFSDMNTKDRENEDENSNKSSDDHQRDKDQEEE